MIITVTLSHVRSIQNDQRRTAATTTNEKMGSSNRKHRSQFEEEPSIEEHMRDGGALRDIASGMMAGAAMGGSGIGVTGSGRYASEPAIDEATAVLGGVATSAASGKSTTDEQDPHNLNKRNDRD